jgi:hypothetical protein
MTGSSHDVEHRNPQTRADLSVYPLDDELVVYDPENGESYILNPTGRLVWERCDGRRTSGDIAREIAAFHSVPATRALAHVNELLAMFEVSNLLTTGEIR